MGVTIDLLDEADKPYVLASWRESHKQAPGVDKMPWRFYKREYGDRFVDLLADHDVNTVFGAYADSGLVGWLIGTPGKRVHTLHWVQTRFRTRDGEGCRRQGVMTALLDAANLGDRFVYTLRADRRRAKLADGTYSQTLDQILADWLLHERNQVAVYTPFLEWLK